MIGIDEVGRGSWAGPLVVCAARLRGTIDGLADSKALSAKKRLELLPIIMDNADLGFGWISADEIDDIGLSAALKQATAIAMLEIGVHTQEEIIIDGNVSFVPSYKPVRLVPKADTKIPAVSAASIAAKVVRDARMNDLAQHYPEYGFMSHVGYGTQQHREAIIRYGRTPLHRNSFRLPKAFATLAE